METNYLDWLAIFFVIVGALNWGVVGLTSLIFGDPLNPIRLASTGIFLPAAGAVVVHVVYVLVGVAGLYLIYTAYKMRRATRRTSSSSITDVESR